MTNAKWRITFPITKAEARSDGLYIIGEATGPEVDGDKERMHPDAIRGFADQIAKAVENDAPLPYRDAHAKDGVLRDLGEIVGGWLTEKMHLGIEVRLDADNPAAVYLFNRVSKGKKYGMSVAGSVLDYADDYVAELGHVVRTFKNVVLDEISNTTRPAWTPSLGTVLSKAIKDAEEEELEVEKAVWSTSFIDSLPDSSFAYIAPGGHKDSEGKTEPRSLRHLPYKDANGKVDAAHVRDALSRLSSTDIPASAKAEAQRKLDAAAKEVGITTSQKSEESMDDEAQAAPETTEKNETPEAVEETVEAVAEDANDAEHAEKAESPAEPVEEVEKAGRAISAATANVLMSAHADLQAAIAAFGQRLASLGIMSPDDVPDAVTESGPVAIDDPVDPVKSDSSEPAEPTVEKSEESDGSLVTRLAELEKALREQTALVEELRKAPANGRPPLIAKAQDEVPDPAAALAAMSPHDRLIVGLAARLQGQDVPR